MLLHTAAYEPGRGWSAPWPVDFDSSRTLVVAFGAPDLPNRELLLEELAGRFPLAMRTGCSTAGEILRGEVRDGSLCVAVARFDATALRQASLAIGEAEDSYAAGQELGRELAADDLRAVFVLSDGLHVNGTRLAAGINSVLPLEVTVTGGLAGDGERFGATWVLGRDGAAERRITAVGFYGDRLRVGHGCDAGWSSFGPERRITRAEGNVLYELDGKPALALYKSYLGERAAGLPATALLFPLAIRRPADDARPLIRTVLGVDEATQSLTFAGDIPEGNLARLMRTNTDNLIQSAGTAARAAGRDFGGSGAPLVVAVSCVGRRLVLGERTDEEIECVLDALPAEAAHVGFYSYGEMSPSLPGGGCDLHNQTMTVTLFDEC